MVVFQGFLINVLGSILAIIILSFILRFISNFIRFTFGIPRNSDNPENRALSVIIKNPFPTWFTTVEIVGWEIYQSLNTYPPIIETNLNKLIPRGKKVIFLRRGTLSPINDNEFNFITNSNTKITFVIKIECIISFQVIKNFNLTS